MRKRKTYLKGLPLSPLSSLTHKQHGYERFFNFIFFIFSAGGFVIIGLPILIHLATWVSPFSDFKDAQGTLWLEKIIGDQNFGQLDFISHAAFKKHEVFNFLWAAVPGVLFGSMFWFFIKMTAIRSSGISVFRYLFFVIAAGLCFSALYFFFALFEEQKGDYWEVSKEQKTEKDQELWPLVGHYALKAVGWITSLGIFVLPFMVIVVRCLIFVGYRQFTIDYRLNPQEKKPSELSPLTKKTPSSNWDEGEYYEFAYQRYCNLLNLSPNYNHQELEKAYEALLKFYKQTSGSEDFYHQRAAQAFEAYRFLEKYTELRETLKN